MVGKEKRKKNHFCSSSVSPFYLHSRGSHHLVGSMAEEEETPIAVDVEIVKKSLLPLQDPWYCSSPLFPMVPTDISASDALSIGIYGVKPLILKLHECLQHLGLWICASSGKSFYLQ